MLPFGFGEAGVALDILFVVKEFLYGGEEGLF